MAQEIWTREDGFFISMEKQYLDRSLIHNFLSEHSYWAKGIARELVEKCIENSAVCYGIYQGNPAEDPQAKQVGFARVVSDFVRFSWLGDVFVLPEYRGLELGKWLVGVIVEHPYLKGTSFNLGTADAHTLYNKFGFAALDKPENRLARPLNWDLVNSAYQLQNKA
ncbi:GNAT family N-acetyltransferase [Brevibacillus sp. SYSU BS000544]|uniref:GNAT family N-acetyltransferase n=1 Tax=Brevibacillus sp. SYSU BS000544 TaxID=3416443 RepID=UPI003CE58F81